MVVNPDYDSDILPGGTITNYKGMVTEYSTVRQRPVSKKEHKKQQVYITGLDSNLRKEKVLTDRL